MLSIKPFVLALVRRIITRPRLTVAVFGGLLTAALAIASQIRFDDGVDVFFDTRSPSYIHGESWKDEFGSDDLVIIALKADTVFTNARLAMIRTLTAAAERLDHVTRVTSLTTVNRLQGDDGAFIVERLIPDRSHTPDELAALQTYAVRHPLYSQNVISPDGRTAAVILELAPSIKQPGLKQQLMSEVLRSIREIVPADVTYHISGLGAIEYYYAAFMREDLAAFGPIMMIVVTLILFAAFRDWRMTLMPLATILTSLGLTVALIPLFGFAVNNVTTMVPPILLAIVVADSVHLVNEARSREEAQGGDLHRAIIETVDHLFLPCFLTSVTTAVGFWSLIVTQIAPIRQLGIVVGIGVMFAWALTLTLLPALIALSRTLIRPQRVADRSAGPDRMGHLLRRISEINIRYPRRILLITFLVLAAAGWGITRLKAETSILESFQKTSTIYRDTLAVENNLAGVHPVNISLKAGEGQNFYDPRLLARLDALALWAARIPEVDKVSSVNDYLKDINRAFHQDNPAYARLPEQAAMTAQYALLYGRDDLENFVDEEWRWATVRIRLKEHSTVKLSAVIHEIEEYVAREFADLAEARVLGRTVLEVESNDTVTRGQLQSLGLAMIVIFGMMFIMLRSLKIGLVSIVPNMIPIIINFGLMGVLGIRLNSATSMVAAIGIGIAVDDTIHFLHGFLEHTRAGEDTATAITRTLAERGRAIIFTSVILFFGFGVVAFSRFVVTAHFGLLSATLMLTALIADLFVTESVLLVFQPRTPPRRET